jgi:arylsulfatase A-like enzyme
MKLPVLSLSVLLVAGCSARIDPDLPVVYDLLARLEHASVEGAAIMQPVAGGSAQSPGSKLAWRLVVPRQAALRVQASVPRGTRAEAILVEGERRTSLASWPEDDASAGISLADHGGKRVTLELVVEGGASVEWRSAVVTGVVEPRDVNLLVFTIDSLRADHVGAYGYSRPTTPHLDALAARGTTFLEAFSVSNESGPAHASLFTGRYPQSHALVKNTREIDPQERTLADYLARAGFQTSAHVNFPILGHRKRAARGFEHVRIVPGTPKAVSLGNRRENVYAYARSWLDAAWRERFFLWVHSQFLHLEAVPEPYVSMFLPTGWKPGPDGLRIAGQELEHTRQLMRDVNEGKRRLSPEALEAFLAAYDGALRMTDEYVGLVLRELARHGLDPFTAIVVTSDHGMTLGEFGQITHVGRPHDHQLHVPLILALPGSAQLQGRKVAGLIELVDVAPTLLSYFGVGVPRRMKGLDLMPAISGAEFAGRSEVFAWIASTPETNWRSIRNRRWRHHARDGAESQWVDVSRAGPEDQRVAAAPPPEAPALLAALEQWARETPISRFVDSGPLPPELRESLEKAGYLEAER